jgi:hypothetical protein
VKLVSLIIKRYIIPKGQSRIDHSENWLHWLHKTQGAGKQSKTQNRHKQISTRSPPKNPGVNISGREYFTNKAGDYKTKNVLQVLIQYLTLSHLIQLRGW